MLLTCENCQTIFRVDAKAIAPQGQRVRCSVCKHVWRAEPGKPVEKPQTGLLKETARGLRYPALIIAVLMLVSGGLYSFRGPLTAHFPALISSFDLAGLTIMPDPSVLEVRDLKAQYTEPLLRSEGRCSTSVISVLMPQCCSCGFWTQTAQNYTSRKSPLTVISLKPDCLCRFFAQFEVDGAKQAQVIVEPVAERLPPRLF